MSEKYFDKCRTAEELKKAYRTAAKKLHPDAGGDPELFKAMQAEFSAAWEKLKNVHMNASGERYEKATTETAAEFMELIEKLFKLDGVVIEICGAWLWVTGNTYPHRDELKKLRFGFSAKKSAWYFHYEPYKKHSKRELSMNQIRDMFGSQRVERGTTENPGKNEKPGELAYNPT